MKPKIKVKDALMHTVRADVNGTLPPAAAQELRLPHNLRVWYDALVELLQECEAGLSELRSIVNALHVECLAQGPRGKSLFFEKKRGYFSKRDQIVRFKADVSRRIAEAKRLIRDKSEGRSPGQLSDHKAARHRDAVKMDEMWDLIRWASKLIPRTGDCASWHHAAKTMGFKEDLDKPEE